VKAPEHAEIWHFSGRAVLDVFLPHRAHGATHIPEKRQGGQPPRSTVPVHLSKPRGRPPACHRRGRGPSIRPRATAPMVRRSGASEPEATQKAGGPGRPRSRSRCCDRTSGSQQHQRSASGPSSSKQGQRPATSASERPRLPDTASESIVHGCLRVVQRERIDEEGSDFKGMTNRRGGDP